MSQKLIMPHQSETFFKNQCCTLFYTKRQTVSIAVLNWDCTAQIMNIRHFRFLCWFGFVCCRMGHRVWIQLGIWNHQNTGNQFFLVVKFLKMNISYRNIHRSESISKGNKTQYHFLRFQSLSSYMFGFPGITRSMLLTFTATLLSK